MPKEIWNRIWLALTYLPDRRADSATPPSSQLFWLGNPARAAVADLLLLLLAFAAVAVCIFTSGSHAGLVLVLMAGCLLPGSAFLTRLQVDNPVEGLGLAVTLSFSFEALGGLAMVWSGWWHPYVWSLALLTIALMLIAVDLSSALRALRNRRLDQPQQPGLCEPDRLV
jgi:uncharacterized membrane protein